VYADAAGNTPETKSASWLIFVILREKYRGLDVENGGEGQLLAETGKCVLLFL
jgi:hypothetical protein